MANAVLIINAGSSSIKFAVFETVPTAENPVVVRGEIEAIGTTPHFVAHDGDAKVVADQAWGHAEAADHSALIGRLLTWVDAHLGDDRLVGVGHRVVHGGHDFIAPVRLDDATLQALDALTPLAPLHQPGSLAPVRAIRTLRPNLPQVACFDTAFHSTMSPVASRLALPRDYAAAGVRRYGFHGLSYEYIARTLRRDAPELAAGKVIVAHLGNGASLCAMQDGRSVDTTMGFTALDGLVMGTRCGALDPGVILYMLKEQGLDAAEIEDILYKRSGLLGLSGVSSDMRDLASSSDDHAREAVESFVFRIAREAAAMASTLGGLDGFVFTAGIGEHAEDVRAAVCDRLAWLGVRLDADANRSHASRIGAVDSRVDVRVIQTDEESTIFRHTADVLRMPS